MSLNQGVEEYPDCDDSLIEEVFALMKLRFIIFLHITNRAVYIESTCLYMSDKRRRERKPREKRKESMHSINDSDERAHTLRRYLNDRSANERNVDIQCYVSNNDRQAMYHHYQRHLHYNCYTPVPKSDALLGVWKRMRRRSNEKNLNRRTLKKLEGYQRK